MKKIRALFWMFCTIFLGECRGSSQPEFGRWSDFTPIADERDCPQTGSILIKQCPVPSHMPQRSSFEGLKQSWLLSWSNRQFNWSESIPDSLSILDSCYRENFRPCTDQLWIKEVKNNTNRTNVDGVSAKGVMVSHALIRKLPTNYPCYIKKPGYDFFLDRLQNVYIAAGTPVYISHYSKDRAWVMIEDVASKAVGFVKIHEVALLTPPQINAVKDLPIAVFFQDNIPLYDSSGQFAGYSRLGQIIFVKKEDDRYVWILWPQRHTSGYVRWETIRVSKTVISTKPLPWTNQNIARTMDTLLGKPYGWGGTLENRDCSSMAQDYFRIFGYALPRNSKAQIESGKKVLDLSGKSNDEKERFIIKYGIPYQTILYCPGHVVLYVGTYKGKVLIAHSKYSVPFMKNQVEGSHIIGQSLVSTLYFDRDIPQGTKFFIDHLSAMMVVE
jgi:cell wall-associated NlpC family hydrolase